MRFRFGSTAIRSFSRHARASTSEGNARLQREIRRSGPALESNTVQDDRAGQTRRDRKAAPGRLRRRTGPALGKRRNHEPRGNHFGPGTRPPGNTCQLYPRKLNPRYRPGKYSKFQRTRPPPDPHLPTPQPASTCLPNHRNSRVGSIPGLRNHGNALTLFIKNRHLS